MVVQDGRVERRGAGQRDVGAHVTDDVIVGHVTDDVTRSSRESTAEAGGGCSQ